MAARQAQLLVPVAALSKIFRAKFRDELLRAGLLDQINPAVWQKNWVVHSKPVGDGRAALKYLAAHVFRVAIGDRRIRSCDHGNVTFSYRKSGSRRARNVTVDAQGVPASLPAARPAHRLPEGALLRLRQRQSHKIFDQLRRLLALRAGQTFVLHARQALLPTPTPTCPACGGSLSIIRLVRCAGRALFDTS